MPITQLAKRPDFNGPQVHIAVARPCLDEVRSIHLMSFLSTVFVFRHTSLQSIVFFNNIATPFNLSFNPCVAAFPFNLCVMCRKKASGNGCFYCQTLRGKCINVPRSSPRLNFITRSVLILFLPGKNLVPIVHGEDMSLELRGSTSHQR